MNDMRTKAEIEQIVIMVRLELHNKSSPCGPSAIRKVMDEDYCVRPLPSPRTISRILASERPPLGHIKIWGEDNPDRGDRPAAEFVLGPPAARPHGGAGRAVESNQ